VEVFLLGKKKQESQVEEGGHLPEPGDA
jgi:hypothetical protein